MSSEPPSDRMPEELAVRAEKLGKCYHIYERPHHRLLQAAWRWRKTFYKPFWALRDATFDVRRGEMLAVLGRNGGGKSTLLQVLAGTLSPSEGRALVRGRVAALLELGSGFNPEFSGRDNVYLNAAILGLSRDETRARFDDIVAFSGIGEFLDRPVKTYSSGMAVRLAFAVAAHVDADVLMVDEALAVGDAAFQARCFRRLDDLRERGVTVLLATHDLATAEQRCDRALLLDGGQMVEIGPPRGVVRSYYKLVMGAGEFEAPKDDSAASAADEGQGWQRPEESAQATRLGDGRASVLRFRVLDERGRPVRSVESRGQLRVECVVRFDDAMAQPAAGAALRDKRNTLVVGAHTQFSSGDTLGPVAAGDVVRFAFAFPAACAPGDYLLMLGVADHDTGESWKDCDTIFDAERIAVVGARSWGLVNTDTSVHVERATQEEAIRP